MSPQVPKLNVLIKLHKATQPIRSVVNYKCAPTYKISKFMAKLVKKVLNLPYTYITNTLQCAENMY
jgi:hypothetical protein